ncbi:hybrid sensor histidine kinase/response regulator [Sphingomonas nostoxanthinifaciens]|uniref:hybrid sensor histidine kinase/response regulator n=1 Tax=Sphingomonas nostoxanthinifaciens TaxID=2872652 RepID=UPI001CC21165|nr:PAS domain-containing sensor histidine kinase [Sphingomonas nostoxanthinifaciens]UAK23131.1 PAS domain-containing protein [Sphingomonas nostoxanthinifaciens]
MPNNALNRWIIDSATDFAIIATDRSGKITAWNKGAELTLGWTETEMLGELVDRIFTPEDLAGDRPAVEMQCALETGAGNDERWHLRKNGERFWANGEMTVLRDDAGGAVGFVKVLRDRTEQRLATETLRGGQANIRLLLDTMIEGFYAVDPDGVTTVCNAAFLRMMGFEKEEDAVGRKLHDVIHGKHPDGTHYDVVDCPIYRCARDGTPAHIRGELFFPINGADPVPVEYWAVPIAPGGIHQGAMCTFIEITEERNASERLKLALDAGAIVGTWFWDVLADRFIADDRFADSFGLSHELCQTGLPLEKVVESIHPDDQARVNEAIAAALAQGGAYRCEYRVKHIDGVFHWIEANGRVEKDAEGRAIHFPGVLLDIEARRAAEAERDSATELLRSFTETVPGVVYAKDREGRLLIGNRGTTDLLGRAPEDYIGRTDLELLDDKAEAAQIMANDRRIMESGRSEQTEEEVRLADGTPAIWLSTKSPVFNGAGEVVGIVGSSVDVTARIRAEAAVLELNRTLEERIVDAIAEREKVEEALRQSQKMEAVGQLTGGLAHDFNNLLTGMMGNLELLQARIARGRVDDIDRFILAAQGAGRRAASLTQRLLAFSRRQTLDPKPIDVNRLIGGMEELLARTVGPTTMVEVVGAAGLWPANIDAGQLENALLNLSINARDAMPDGGRLTIETANKWLDDRAAKERDLIPGQYLSVCVTDTGSGMSAETIGRAFEPFYTTKPIGQGTGLGLSMVYGFARQSGGQVRIYSEVGSGTTVCIYLPRHIGDAPEPQTEGAKARPDAANGQTILVVDDEPTIRHLIDEVLEDAGYTVIGAADGAAGLKVLQSGARIELLITDVGLPNGMNGRQVADAARALRPNLKVLFITGYAENAAVGNGHLEPGMELLTKPFSMEALAVKVAAILELPI